MGMTIDGWDISEVRAEQWRLTIGHHSLKNNSQWNNISGRPEFIRPEIGFKSVTVDVLVKGDSYEDIVANTGTLLSKLTDVVDIQFERSSHYFKLILDKDPKVDEKSKDRWHIVTLEFVGYEYGDEQVIAVENSVGFTIDNIGNMVTPVTLYITPTASTIIGERLSENVYPILDGDGGSLLDITGEVMVGYEEVYGGLKISGICVDQESGEDEDVLIKNYHTGVTVKIDGETGLIMEGNEVKIEDVDIWSLPSIKPGLNVIKTNGEFMHIEVRYRPRYM